jgi:hypothetical protein
MPVIGIRLDKITAEINKSIRPEGAIRVAPTPRILNVQESQIAGATGKVNVLEINFEYVAVYDPPVGEITLEGILFFQEGENERKAALKAWKEEHRLAVGGADIINSMIQRCFLVIMNLARELNLPNPLPMRVEAQDQGSPPPEEKPKKKK